ncbi:hypothetical protein OEZ86_013171 [Tetradesmus obliquus]|nr:hypothetical protein OEZ86_013171 [Tetradesmus obliquus]
MQQAAVDEGAGAPFQQQQQQQQQQEQQQDQWQLLMQEAAEDEGAAASLQQKLVQGAAVNEVAASYQQQQQQGQALMPAAAQGEEAAPFQQQQQQGQALMPAAAQGEEAAPFQQQQQHGRVLMPAAAEDDGAAACQQQQEQGHLLLQEAAADEGAAPFQQQQQQPQEYEWQLLMQAAAEDEGAAVSLQQQGQVLMPAAAAGEEAALQQQQDQWHLLTREAVEIEGAAYQQEWEQELVQAVNEAAAAYQQQQQQQQHQVQMQAAAADAGAAPFQQRQQQQQQQQHQVLMQKAAEGAGTLSVSGGWDFINPAEVTIASVMSAAGYHTAHMGKWHNAQTLGYEPWHAGFQDSFMPPPETARAGKGLGRHNGVYFAASEQQGHLYDHTLSNITLKYLKERAADRQPFLAYLATRAIHSNYNYLAEDGRLLGGRYAPPQYRRKYNQPEFRGVTESTKDAWALLEYLDDALGPIFNYLESSGLDRNTFVMFSSDNGAAIYPDEENPAHKKVRMPSGMKGWKGDVFEGGVRTFLAVQGPGITPGAVDSSSLLSIMDILPTVVDLTGTHSTGRYIVILGPQCWGPDAVPKLGADREVVKPQLLLNFHQGGRNKNDKTPKLPGPGFLPCTVVRHGQFKWHGYNGKVYSSLNLKWHGYNGKVYRIDHRHLESAATEVKDAALAASLAKRMSKAAEDWWASVVSDPHSFSKPTFFLGMGSWTVTNLLAAGAHERTPKRVTLLLDGASGFSEPGDSMCWKIKVLREGMYDVAAIYSSSRQAPFKLSVGMHRDIQAGRSLALRMQLPAQARMRGVSMGSLWLAPSGSQKTEACLQLLPTRTGTTGPAFKHLGALQFTSVTEARLKRTRRQANAGSTRPATELTTGGSFYNYEYANSSMAAEADSLPIAEPAPSLDVSGNLGWLADVADSTVQALTSSALGSSADLAVTAAVAADGASSSSGSSSSSSSSAWDVLRLQHGWPDGQSELESLYSPFDSEGIAGCTQQDEACSLLV